MTKKEPNISIKLSSMTEWFIKRTCQLYKVTADYKVEAEGSGILILLNCKYFLLTAGHVLFNKKINQLCIPNLKSGGMETCFGTWYPSDIKSNVGKDPNDFAYLILSNEQVDHLLREGYKFITESNIDFEHKPSESKIYTCAGFKWRKTKRIINDHHSELCFMTNFGGKKYLYSRQVDGKNKVIIRNERKMLNPFNLTKGKTGYLEGMSGGGLWNTEKNFSYSNSSPNIKLVGILNWYDNESIESCNINEFCRIAEKRNHL